MTKAKFFFRGNCISPQFVMPNTCATLSVNSVRNLRGIDVKRFLPLVEMTIDAFFDFCNYLVILPFLLPSFRALPLFFRSAPIRRLIIPHLHWLCHGVYLQPIVSHLDDFMPGEVGWVFDRLLHCGD